MNVLRWMLLLRCIYRVSKNCCLSGYLNTAGLWKSPEKICEVLESPELFCKQESGNRGKKRDVFRQHWLLQVCVLSACRMKCLYSCCDNVCSVVHCKSSPGLFDECRMNVRWPVLRPSQPSWAWVQICHCHLLLLLSLKGDTHFSIPPPPHHTTTVLRPFFRDHPGAPVPEENFWTLWCKGRLTEADTVTIQLGATPSSLTSAHLHHSPHIFCRPDFSILVSHRGWKAEST